MVASGDDIESLCSVLNGNLQESYSGSVGKATSELRTILIIVATTSSIIIPGALFVTMMHWMCPLSNDNIQFLSVGPAEKYVVYVITCVGCAKKTVVTLPPTLAVGLSDF